MSLEEVLKQEFIKVNIKTENKESLLREIAKIAKISPILNSYTEEDVFQALMEREKLSSTGFGKKVAIPHCTLDKIEEFVIGIITLSKGVDFAAVDGQKVQVVAFIIAPTSKRNQHIRFLSNISSILRNPSNVEEILRAKTAAEVRKSFLQHLEFKENSKEKDYNLFYVVIQEEEKFEDILTVFTEIEDCSMTVLDGNNAGFYLYASPLFSNLWSEREKGFNKIIFALVKKSISNEVIRKLNMFIKDLKNQSGIMFVVQELFYANGSLDI